MKAADDRSMSKVVFVGNVPYDVEEDKLTPIFSTVGPIAGFRLMIEKDTGKSKGYAFCEYYDHETAASAVRNLNGSEVNGRPLRIDLADSDPFFEGKSTQAGRTKPRDEERREREKERSDPLANLPLGVSVPPGQTATDVITTSVGQVPPKQMMEILGQMKAYVQNSPDHARNLLNAHPQLAYAFFQSMVLNQLIDQSILQRMLTTAALQTQPPPPVAAPAPVPPVQPPYQAPPPPTYRPVPPAPVPAPPYYGAAPPPPVPAPSAYQQPQAPYPPNPAVPGADIPEDQRAMLMQILSLTPDQIAGLPPAERATIQQLRAQFTGSM